MRLIIVRHGETFGNKTLTIQGQKDGQLSDEGKDQARKLAERLKNEKIDFIYSSDLTRTKDTVSAIIKHHPGVGVVYDTLLRERNFGIYEGQPMDVLFNNNPESLKALHAPEKGETVKDLRSRVNQFMKALFMNHKPNETILVCTHGGWKHAFVGYFLGLSYNSNLVRKFWFDNTALSIFEFGENGNHIKLLNCTKHLD